jgi:hypothetical protein
MDYDGQDSVIEGFLVECSHVQVVANSVACAAATPAPVV